MINYNNLTCEDSKINEIEFLKVQLKEHQKTAVHAMLQFENSDKITFSKDICIKNYFIYDKEYCDLHSLMNMNDCPYMKTEFEIESNFGILADKVGSGKTYMIMALICKSLIPKLKPIIYTSSLYAVLKYKCSLKTTNINLIIVPHNLILQWKSVFEKCSLKTFCIVRNNDINNIILDKYDVIIVSSTMFDSFYLNYSDIKWARIIIDEVVNIKLPHEFEFKCNFLWLITATPSGLKHIKKTYIKYLLHNINYYILNNLIIKNNDNYVDESLNLPDIRQLLINCITPHEINIIRGLVDKEIINMINAGNIQEAILKLNCNVETSENILAVLSKKLFKDIHNKKMELEYELKRIPDDKKAQEEKLKKLNDKINSLTDQQKSIEEKIKTINQEICAICMDNFSDPVLLTCCNNLICFTCIVNCKKCPMCRNNINVKDLIVISDNKLKNVKKKNILCSKFDNLINLLEKNEKGKFLIFSTYEKTFENLSEKLYNKKIIYSRLVGSNHTINNIISKFNQGKIKVLLLNALNYGSGLNLHMATDIIIYHELERELETQVIGRAQRLGRTSSLNVYYLLNENEKINCKYNIKEINVFKDNSDELDEFLSELK